jgi:hypothetical protein
MAPPHVKTWSVGSEPREIGKAASFAPGRSLRATMTVRRRCSTGHPAFFLRSRASSCSPAYLYYCCSTEKMGERPAGAVTTGSRRQPWYGSPVFPLTRLPSQPQALEGTLRLPEAVLRARSDRVAFRTQHAAAREIGTTGFPSGPHSRKSRSNRTLLRCPQRRPRALRLDKREDRTILLTLLVMETHDNGPLFFCSRYRTWTSHRILSCGERHHFFEGAKIP